MTPPPADLTRAPTVAIAGAAAIPRIGFGTAEIGNLHGALTEAEAQRTLAAAADAGIGFYDCAPGYGAGLSELRLGAFLRDRPRDSYVVSTKIGRIFAADAAAPPGLFAGPLPFRATFDYSYGGVMRSFEQSTLRMGLTRIDMLFVHDLDRRNHGAAFEEQYRSALDGGMNALAELRRAGDIGMIGAAVNEGDVGARMLADGDFGIALLASRYTLLEQDAARDFLPLARRRGIGVIAGGVFNSGILATGATPGARYDYVAADAGVLARVDRLQEVARRHGVALPAAAMQFVLAHPAIVALLIGSARPERIARNVAALAAPIPDEFWSELLALGLLAAGSPVPAPSGR